MRKLSRPIRAESIGQRSAERRHVARESGRRRRHEPQDEKKCEKAGQGERQNQRDVVSRERIRVEQLHGRGEEPHPRKVFGEGKRPGHRIEDRGIPPALRERDRVRIPPEQPDVQDRIARVVRYPRRDVSGKRPGPDEGERQKRQEDWKRAPPHRFGSILTQLQNSRDH